MKDICPKPSIRWGRMQQTVWQYLISRLGWERHSFVLNRGRGPEICLIHTNNYICQPPIFHLVWIICLTYFHAFQASGTCAFSSWVPNLLSTYYIPSSVKWRGWCLRCSETSFSENRTATALGTVNPAICKTNELVSDCLTFFLKVFQCQIKRNTDSGLRTP